MHLVITGEWHSQRYFHNQNQHCRNVCKFGRNFYLGLAHANIYIHLCDQRLINVAQFFHGYGNSDGVKYRTSNSNANSTNCHHNTSSSKTKIASQTLIPFLCAMRELKVFQNVSQRRFLETGPEKSSG